MDTLKVVKLNQLYKMCKAFTDEVIAFFQTNKSMQRLDIKFMEIDFEN